MRTLRRRLVEGLPFDDSRFIERTANVRDRAMGTIGETGSLSSDQPLTPATIAQNPYG
jgi:hypothetical protein